MASIIDWKTAGVTLKVELSETPQLTLVADPAGYTPFAPGGSSGVPLGWSPDLRGTPPPTLADVTFSTSAAGVFSITPTATPGTDKSVGCYKEITAQPNVRYQFQVEVACQPGKVDCARYVALEEYNPTTLQTVTLASTSFTFITNTNFELTSIQATRAVNIAGGFTILRIRVDGSRKGYETTTGAWGILYQNPELFARALTMPTITWRDITCDVKAMTTRYGREQTTNRYDVANMQMVLDNADGRYSFADPHPFNFGPGRQVRFTAKYAGTTYPMAYCIVDGINDAVDVDGRSVTNVMCVDVTTVGANLPQAISGPASQGGNRVYQLADYVGYLYTRLDSGVFNMLPLSPSGRSVRDEMGLTADSEGGAVFGDRDGYIVFKDRRWQTLDDNLKSVTANLWAKPESDQPYFDHTPDQSGLPTLCVASLVTDWNMSRVINSISLANVGGTAKQYDDLPSQRKNGERTYQRHDFVLQSTTDLDTRANDIMTGYTQPRMRLRSITFRPDLEENDWAWSLRVFLNYLVRVWYQNSRTGYGWLMVTHVQSVEHRITPTTWETTLQVDLPTYFGDAPVQATYAWDDPRAHWDTTGVWV